MDKFISKRVPADQVQEFLRVARERYVYALQIDAEDRALAEEDANFAIALPVKGAGTSQWHAEAAQARIKSKRPCLTENRLPTFTAQVVNDGRQSKPAIKIAAMDNGTKDTAEYFQGRIRQIEYECNADIAYDTSREQQVTSGRAFLRVTWDYVRGSFKRMARIEPITNQFSVVFGPAREYDCGDAEYCFVISLVTKEQHIRDHGKEITAARLDFSSENPYGGWLGAGPNGEMIQKAEYWLKEYKRRTLCRLSNDKEYYKDELPAGLDALGITIVETRTEQDCTVTQYIIDGADILDEIDIEGPYIGIVPLWGREWFVDGTRRTSSLIRYAKEPQRLLNLYVSNIAEQIAQMAKVPYFIPVGGIPAGSQQQYDNLNNDPRQYAFYNQYDAQMRRLDAPSRVTAEPPIAALVNGYNQAVDAIKAAMGIFDASIGAESNEVSGLAINSRKKESDNANFHFHDNEARTRKQIGRILLCWIPKLDKGKGNRAVRSEDGKTTMVRVGEPFKDEKTGKTIIHELDKGDYGVAVDTSQSYLSARDEGFETYTKMAAQWPLLLQVGGPAILRMSGIPGSDDLADLMEKTLPPGLQPQKPGAANQIPPELQQKVQQIQQQAGQMIDQLSQELQRLQGEIEAQTVQTKSRERIAEMQETTKRLIALGTLDQKEALTLLQNELASIKHRLDLSNAEEDRAGAAKEADASRAHQADQANQDRTHQATMAATPPPVDPNSPPPPPTAADAAQPAAPQE